MPETIQGRRIVCQKLEMIDNTDNFGLLSRETIHRSNTSALAT